ncbi:hypothetical protein, partial [Salmonella enterica]|uniref:hypothetical protein n=1 Tax=Salmonella enterica TaxID=28901 RepID=UPI00294B32B9
PAAGKDCPVNAEARITFSFLNNEPLARPGKHHRPPARGRNGNTPPGKKNRKKNFEKTGDRKRTRLKS